MIRKDFVGISSDNVCEKHAHRKPKVSYVKLICIGLVEPKARPKGVVDGNPVNIPEPINVCCGIRSRVSKTADGCR